MGVEVAWSDKTHAGRHLEVAFTGVLREDQELAAQAMLRHDCGVLAAATAFGKTVIAARLIGERKTSTLILTHRRQLMSQWMAKLDELLDIGDEIPVLAKKRGRRPAQGHIGQIGAGKENPRGIIDVAIMQSLASVGEVKECVRARDLASLASNATRGVAAESAMILCNRLVEKELSLPELLPPLLRRFARDRNVAVRVSILRRLPYLMHKRPELGWQLLEDAFREPQTHLWAHAERCFYYEYRDHFDRVQHYLDRLLHE